ETFRRRVEGTYEVAGERRTRLFGCACVRRGWALLGEGGRNAVEAAEAYADRRVGNAVLVAAREGVATSAECFAGDASFWVDRPHAYGVASASEAAVGLVGAWSAEQASSVARYVCLAAHDLAEAKAKDRLREPSVLHAELAYLTLLLDDVARPLPVFSPAVLAHNDAAVVKLARVVYEDRDPATGLLDAARLAILADALEDAGAL